MYLSVAKVVTCMLVLGLLACGEKSNAVRESARESLGVSNTQPVPPTAPTSSVPVTITDGGVVYHYICPNKCQGSGGAAAGTCPVCGSEYVHNADYHNQPAGSTVTTSTGTQKVTFEGSTTTSPATPATPPAPEPAQNAQGVWHYTCPKGCEGGAGSTGICASCGTALVHNAAYHQ